MYTVCEEQKAAGTLQRQNVMLCYESPSVQQSSSQAPPLEGCLQYWHQSWWGQLKPFERILSFYSLDHIHDFLTLYFEQGSAVLSPNRKRCLIYFFLLSTSALRVLMNGLASATLNSLGEQHNPNNKWSIVGEYTVHSLFHPKTKNDKYLGVACADFLGHKARIQQHMTS